MIGKQARGFYILIDYAGVSDVVNELERNLKIDDKILKFMTVLKAERVDREALEKEIADAMQKDEKKEVPVPAPEAIPAIAAAETDAADAAVRRQARPPRRARPLQRPGVGAGPALPRARPRPRPAPGALQRDGAHVPRGGPAGASQALRLPPPRAPGPLPLRGHLRVGGRRAPAARPARLPRRRVHPPRGARARGTARERLGRHGAGSAGGPRARARARARSRISA